MLSNRHKALGRWMRFAIGLAGMTATIAFFMSGFSLPGMAGEVLRHNQVHDIDASPLFYSEVEHMAELEAGVVKLRQQAATADTALTGDSLGLPVAGSR